MQKLIFCHFWNGKKCVFVLLKLDFFPILEHYVKWSIFVFLPFWFKITQCVIGEGEWWKDRLPFYYISFLGRLLHTNWRRRAERICKNSEKIDVVLLCFSRCQSLKYEKGFKTGGTWRWHYVRFSKFYWHFEILNRKTG